MSQTVNPTSRALQDGWKAQLRVFRGLILRELHARYGRENVGFLWVIGEPMILASVITIIHLNQPSHSADTGSLAAFAIIGYGIFIIFRNTFNQAAGAIESNQPLLYHRMVTIFDIVVARAVMDIMACYAVIVVLLTICILTGLASWPARPIYLITAALLMGWFTLGLTLIASCATYRNELWERQIHVMSYLSIPISGAWFSLSALPPAFRDALQWFPMPLIFEQARYGQFESSPGKFVSPGYVVGCCAALTFAGLLFTRRIRAKVHG
jgi:capsular polysaccharide transport system permease protein